MHAHWRPAASPAMLAKGFGMQQSGPSALPKLPLPPKTQKAKTDRFQLEFTCNKCNTRNSHSISRLAYGQGTVIATCPGCKTGHLVSDNLNWLEDDFKNIKEAMAKRGQPVTDLRVQRDGVAREAAAVIAGEVPKSDLPIEAPPSRLPGISEEQALRIREAVRAHKQRRKQEKLEARRNHEDDGVNDDSQLNM